MIPIISCQTSNVLRTKSEYNFPSLSGFSSKSFLGRQTRNQLSPAASHDGQSVKPEVGTTSASLNKYDHSYEGYTHCLHIHPCRSFGVRSRHGRYLRNSIVIKKQRRKKKQPLESKKISIECQEVTTTDGRLLNDEDVKKVIACDDEQNRLKRKRKRTKQSKVMKQQHFIICSECSKESKTSTNRIMLIPCSHTFDATNQLKSADKKDKQVWSSLADFSDVSKVLQNGGCLAPKQSISSSDYSMTSLCAVHGSGASRDRSGVSSDERRAQEAAAGLDCVRNLDESIDCLLTSRRKSVVGGFNQNNNNNDNKNNNNKNNNNNNNDNTSDDKTVHDKLYPCTSMPANQLASSSSSSSSSPLPPLPPPPSSSSSSTAITTTSVAKATTRRKTFVHSRSAIFPAKLSVIPEKSDSQKLAPDKLNDKLNSDMNFMAEVEGPSWVTKMSNESKTLMVETPNMEGIVGWTDYRSSAVQLATQRYQRHLSNQRMLILGHGNLIMKNRKQSTCSTKQKYENIDNDKQATTTSQDASTITNQFLRRSFSLQKDNIREEIQTSSNLSLLGSTDSLKLYNDDHDFYLDKKSSDSGELKHDCRLDGCERLRINVCGQLFETRRAVLERHPETLLGNSYKRQAFFDADRRELFFDRHRPSFEAIFSYYQHGGRLRRPYHVPSDVFLEELNFFELEDDTVEEYKRSEGYIFEENPLPQVGWMRGVWRLFEDPQSSRAAFYVAVLSVFMTLISIVIFCVETLPYFAKSHCVGNEAPNFLDPFFIIETTCTVWFTIEAIARFISCPDKIDFWKDFKNIVDVTAVLPYYWTLFNVLSTMSCAGAKTSASLSFLRVIRLIRVFKLTKHSVGLQVLLLTFKASLEGLGLFLVALMVSLLVFSSAVYYAEYGNPNSNMKSIPDAFWWAIITMTTVGYGDKVPLGVTGRLIGAACAITGVLTLAIPVPIITGHFNRFYSHKTGRGRHV